MFPSLLARESNLQGTSKENGEECLPLAAPDVQVEREALPPKVAYSKQTVIISWALWLALCAFTLLMPNYVPYLNKHFATNTCTFPTSELMRTQNISCVNGADLTKLAREAGRFNIKGQPVACGCGQGVFGEDICPLGFLGQPSMGGFTLSNYIGTPTGSAAFVLFSIGPTAMAWIYGTGDSSTLRVHVGISETWLILVTKATLFLFQALLNIFMMATGCMFFKTHVMTSSLAELFGAVHFALVALVAWKRGRKGPAVIVGAILLVAVIFGGVFASAQLKFKNCNILPGQRHVSPECSKVLENPYASFYPEVGAILTLLVTPSALLTYAAFS